MKKLVFAAVMLCGLVLSARAQEFKPFRVDLGAGYALPFSDGAKGGALFYLEPKYAVMDQISVGFRWEGSLMASVAPDGSKGDAKLSSAYMATGDYFLNNNSFRPFAGVGLGAYSIAGASASITIGDATAESSVDAKTNFGFMIRAGFDISHFRFTVSYNNAGKVGDETHHFLGISVGAFFGGGNR